MNNLPKRKSIRLNEFDYSENNIYFVTICLNNRVNLFGKINEGERSCSNFIAKMVEKWLFEIESAFESASIDKYVIMPNHIHFILINEGVINNKTGKHVGYPLSKIVNWFKTMTTNDYIKGVKQGVFPPFEKHFWQRNYFEHVVRDNSDYLAICKYIDNNALKYIFKE